jgi:hypothetical protein
MADKFTASEAIFELEKLSKELINKQRDTVQERQSPTSKIFHH